MDLLDVFMKADVDAKIKLDILKQEEIDQERRYRLATQNATITNKIKWKSYEYHRLYRIREAIKRLGEVEE